MNIGLVAHNAKKKLMQNLHVYQFDILMNNQEGTY